MSVAVVKIYNFSGTGNAKVYKGPPSNTVTPNSYTTTLRVEQTIIKNGNEVTDEYYKFTLKNIYVTEIGFTAYLKKNAQSGIEKSFWCLQNGLYYNLDFTQLFNKGYLNYSGSLNNSTQIATKETYDKLIGMSSKTLYVCSKCGKLHKNKKN